MTLQFDSNTVASALTAFAPTDPFAAPPRPSASQPSPPPLQTTQSTTTPLLIDWNVSRPDGSDRTIHELLKTIGNGLNAEVHLGRALPNGDAGKIFSSEFATRETSEVSVALKSSVVEACFATGRFQNGCSATYVGKPYISFPGLGKG